MLSLTRWMSALPHKKSPDQLLLIAQFLSLNSLIPVKIVQGKLK